MTQLELHKKIREVLQKDPKSIDKKEVEKLISVNFDAKNYFFAKADKRWLDWLWDNGFLAGAIAKKSEDPTRYSYKTPELRYLVRTAEVKPVKVTEIITKTKKVKGKVKGISATTKDNFNPEVVGQFLRICSELPVRELKKVVPKIKEENWVRLMGVFNQWGFEYGDMLEKLFEAKKYKALLDLADVVLSIKTKGEYKKEKRKFSKSPFYFNDFSNVKVFDYLIKIDNEYYIQEAFSQLTRKLGEIVKLIGEKGKDKDKVFKYCDSYLLLDVDFFSLELSDERYHSGYENIKDLVATIKVLVQKLVSNRCNKPKEARNLYKKYIGDFDDPKAYLPDSHAMWHLRLFVLSLCPKVFKNELKKAFFRLFKVGYNYYEIISGAEYLKALRVGFSVLSETDKHDYVKRVIDCFVGGNKEKESEKENLYLEYGSRILSVLAEAKQLTNNEVKEAKKKGLTIKPNYQPKPLVEIGKVSFVASQSPISCDEFDEMRISEIVEKMKNEWSPKSLEGKYKNRGNFSRPINTSGVVKCLRDDFPGRFQEYINNADSFFDRTRLDPHYTYSFLRSVEEYIRNHRDELKDINWNGLIKKLLIDIKESGEKKSFDCGKRQQNISMGLLADWGDVHSAMADVIQKLLEERNGKVIINLSRYRDDLFEIIKYLLSCHDSRLENKEEINDPFREAINSVRGRAFRAFVLFVYQDGKELEREKKGIKIRDGVKDLYEEVLDKENTRALMFMFGHYLPSFYSRDEEWTKRKLLPRIFPEEPGKKNLYTAAWEGYLSTNLYKQMFFDSDIRKLYKRGLQLTDKDYPKQKHFRNPDEALADHLALAFVHFPKFVKDFPKINEKNKWDKLFEEFWEGRNIKRQREFISFIGRHAISRENPNGWMKQYKINKDKLKKFWDWALEKNLEPDVLAGFGFWVNPNEEVLGNDFVVKKMAKTIKKSGGKVDWDYGLLKRLPAFAEVDPKNTLKIIRYYLLDEEKDNLNPNRYITPVHEGEIKNALEIIYGNGSEKIKQETTQLVNTLIKKGSSMFWDLEDIINE